MNFYGNIITSFSSECHDGSDSNSLNFTLRHPLGVVGIISPWNFPLHLLTWKIAPALATGNCVIAKPSELTPLTATKLAELSVKAGFPPGVFNLLHGQGSKIGQMITEHPQIKAISFTGGTNTGRMIAKAVAPQFKKLSLEMGGKNPTILFKDCHQRKAVQETLRSAFFNQGQVCLCGSRIFYSIRYLFKNQSGHA